MALRITSHLSLSSHKGLRDSDLNPVTGRTPSPLLLCPPPPIAPIRVQGTESVSSHLKRAVPTLDRGLRAQNPRRLVLLKITNPAGTHLPHARAAFGAEVQAA